MRGEFVLDAAITRDSEVEASGPKCIVARTVEAMRVLPRAGRALDAVALSCFILIRPPVAVSCCVTDQRSLLFAVPPVRYTDSPFKGENGT